MLNKRGENVLTGNIVFIILNLVFLSILILFIFSKAGSAAILEEKYAKQIALIIDAAEPEIKLIRLNLEDAISKKDEDFTGDIVVVDNEKNLVTVQLREKGGYSYSFFSNLKIGSYFDYETKEYVIHFEEEGENEEAG